ncbi:hypothetical protein BC829DRAFT_419181 [Chytridium lagenaria]|nr:hypothetical protein BC829DRAFT_419181 [Chytridium lagenaria]
MKGEYNDGETTGAFTYNVGAPKEFRSLIHDGIIKNLDDGNPCSDLLHTQLRRWTGGAARYIDEEPHGWVEAVIRWNKGRVLRGRPYLKITRVLLEYVKACLKEYGVEVPDIDKARVMDKAKKGGLKFNELQKDVTELHEELKQAQAIHSVDHLGVKAVGGPERSSSLRAPKSSQFSQRLKQAEDAENSVRPTSNSLIDSTRLFRNTESDISNDFPPRDEEREASTTRVFNVTPASGDHDSILLNSTPQRLTPTLVDEDDTEIPLLKRRRASASKPRATAPLLLNDSTESNLIERNELSKVFVFGPLKDFNLSYHLLRILFFCDNFCLFFPPLSSDLQDPAKIKINFSVNRPDLDVSYVESPRPHQEAALQPSQFKNLSETPTSAITSKRSKPVKVPWQRAEQGPTSPAKRKVVRFASPPAKHVPRLTSGARISHTDEFNGWHLAPTSPEQSMNIDK